MEGAGGQGTRVSKPWLHCCKCKPRCSSPLTPRIPSKPTGPLCPLRAEKAAHEARQAKSRALGDDEDAEELMQLLNPTADRLQPLYPSQAEKAAHKARQAKSRALGDDEDEEELMKQRERDDWNDTNKRGWGNSALRPCGR